jgi:predicted DNA-binding protein (MmcQ/YjbR family)
LHVVAEKLKLAKGKTVTAQQVLERMRRVCGALSEASEHTTFGHPTFKVKGKAFAVLEVYKGDLSICVNVGKTLQGVFLADARFYRTPYIGQHGWVSLKVHAAPLDWREIKGLLEESYELVRRGRR